MRGLLIAQCAVASAQAPRCTFALMHRPSSNGGVYIKQKVETAEDVLVYCLGGITGRQVESRGYRSRLFRFIVNTGSVDGRNFLKLNDGGPLVTSAITAAVLSCVSENLDGGIVWTVGVCDSLYVVTSHISAKSC